MLQVKMRVLKSVSMRWIRGPRQNSLPGLAVAVAASLSLAFGLTACVNVATYTQPSLVRVIDASYIAPAANVVVEGVLIAANIGQGTITDYATVPANNAAPIKITEATGGSSLVSTDGTILAGYHHSVFLTDNGAASTGYTVTILKDQQVAAAGGHSAFRFLNQAPKVGAVDVYMIPGSTTLANTTPLVTGLKVGSTAGYVSFPSQTVTMVIVPTGLVTPKYTSASLALTGGEVRTVLIVDTQLTSDPPVAVYMATDVK
ncbi:MAG: DUF4397 domain-containing protein [Terracidiphilus sp.]|nr:DUF4397 domain-containing protein [Terracidiphilus sp.]